MAKFKVRRDDLVQVISGKHKGQTGRILRVNKDDARVVVERVNLVKRQVKATAERAGGTVEKEAPIHVSNVALWNAAESRRVKIGWKDVPCKDGKVRRFRFDKKTGDFIDKDLVEKKQAAS